MENPSAYGQGIRYRPAKPQDGGSIRALLKQLGYATEEAQFAARFAAVSVAAGHALLVAEIAGEIVGFAHVALVPLLEADDYAQLLALVVDESRRSRGVGAGLVDQAEAWAAAAGAKQLGLRSNVLRTRAHGFYERLGYERTKTQFAFRRALMSAKNSESGLA
jgi:GNAT superfamily N-acetyltransferase